MSEFRVGQYYEGPRGVIKVLERDSNMIKIRFEDGTTTRVTVKDDGFFGVWETFKYKGDTYTVDGDR